MKFSHYEPCPRCQSIGRDTRGDNLGVYADGSKYCFSCHFRINPSRFITVLEEKLKSNSIYPHDFTRDIPNKALSWLLQYGLPWTYWKDSIGWSEYFQRLVFEVGTPTVFTIGRYFGEEIKRKWYVWGNSHTTSVVYGEGDITVLVEDIISAHKVSQVTRTIPLFGTKIHECHLNSLLFYKTPVILWLDNDQEMVVKKESARLQSILGQPVYYAVTPLDPKFYTTNQLKEFINGIQGVA